MPEELQDVFDEIIGPLQRARKVAQEQIADLEARQQAIGTELAGIRNRLKRTERLMREVDPSSVPEATRRPARKSKRSGNQSIAQDKLDLATRYICDWFREHDTVTQSEFYLAHPEFNSVSASAAFLKLREQNIIRLVRQEGNRKIFRLTDSGRVLMEEMENNAEPSTV